MSETRHHINPPILTHARELRQPQTPAEAKLWACLSSRQVGGFKFRRQHPIDRFIVDFYCPACRLVIEIDGDTHAEQVEYDQARTSWLSEQGYHVIRFSNREVVQHLDEVIEVILGECQGLISPAPQPSPHMGEKAERPT